MKILSVNPNFQGKRDNIDAMINVDENSIRQIAYLKTASETNYDKKRKIADAVMYSAPVAAGLSYMALSDIKQTKIFSKLVKGPAAKLANGLKVGALWGAGLFGIDLMNKTLKAFRNESYTYRNFDNNHPLTSSVATVAGAFGVLAGVERAAELLKDVKAPKFMQDATLKVNKFMNNNEALKNAQKFVSDNFARLPKWVKNTSRYAALWSPEALLLSGIIYGAKVNYNANKELHKNYSAMKAQQSALAQARLRELKVQNDFLMLDAHNQEDAALLKNPKEGLV